MKKCTLSLGRPSFVERTRLPMLIYNLNEIIIKISQIFLFYLAKMILSSLEEQISQNSREYSEKEEQGRETSPTRCSKIQAMVIKTVCNSCRNRWRDWKTPNYVAIRCTHMITRGEKTHVFDKWYWTHWLAFITRKKNKGSLKKKISGKNKDLNVKTTKVLNENKDIFVILK